MKDDDISYNVNNSLGNLLTIINEYVKIINGIVIL